MKQWSASEVPFLNLIRLSNNLLHYITVMHSKIHSKYTDYGNEAGWNTAENYISQLYRKM